MTLANAGYFATGVCTSRLVSNRKGKKTVAQPCIWYTV